MNNADMPWESIAQRILVLRGQKVLLDSDLAVLYGVDTKRLNEQVRRNRERFPVDFIFELSSEELAILRSHFATSRWGGRRYTPLAFTEHGAIMVATILKSPRAAEVSVYVVRAFVQLRGLLASHQELAEKLADLEATTAHLSARHESFALQLAQIIEAIRQLTAVPQAVERRPIGFVIQQDKK